MNWQNSSLLVWFLMWSYFSNAQNIDTLLLHKIEHKFALNESTDIEYLFYSNCHPFEEAKINDRTLYTVIKYLQENNMVSIELNCYTDCLGKERYNLKLSQKWADSIKKWIVNNGISENRIQAFGLGEQSPIAPCENCKCADEVHQKNRRLEIVKVVE